MAAFYVETVEIQTGSNPAPSVLVEAFERDREVLLDASHDGFFVGYGEGDVDVAGQGFPLGVSLVRFKLPANTELWVGENISSPSAAQIQVLVGAA